MSFVVAWQLNRFYLRSPFLYTEWINLIVPVRKSDVSLRLCLAPKDLNKAINPNQYYYRTIDDVLPELVNSKHISLLDAK